MTKPSDAPHPSMQRLLAVARETKKITGPAALADALNESDQVVTNWKRRGVSRAGANTAQEVFGCSSNWILKGTLPRYITGHANDNVEHEARELAPTYGWPFAIVTADQWWQVLQADDRDAVEKAAAALVNARSSAPKQKTPEIHARHQTR